MKVFYYSFSNHLNYDFSNCTNTTDMFCEVEIKEFSYCEMFGVGYYAMKNKDVDYDLKDFGEIINHKTQPNNFHYLSIFSFKKLTNKQEEKIRKMLNDVVWNMNKN